jgi:hypothetical protein
MKKLLAWLCLALCASLIGVMLIVGLTGCEKASVAAPLPPGGPPTYTGAISLRNIQYHHHQPTDSEDPCQWWFSCDATFNCNNPNHAAPYFNYVIGSMGLWNSDESWAGGGDIVSHYMTRGNWTSYYLSGSATNSGIHRYIGDYWGQDHGFHSWCCYDPDVMANLSGWIDAVDRSTEEAYSLDDTPCDPPPIASHVVRVPDNSALPLNVWSVSTYHLEMYGGLPSGYHVHTEHWNAAAAQQPPPVSGGNYWGRPQTSPFLTIDTDTEMQALTESLKVQKTIPSVSDLIMPIPGGDDKAIFSHDVLENSSHQSKAISPVLEIIGKNLGGS